ncbi:MAG: YggS family pyridoxal phosphate-dependent enzyme [Alphaproteobacteria bacterium]|nr:YggS family pyridoxal phosphate-dependent enzyme [Alphaproteobacteria bacterium]MBV8548226.1 YggS family pyridoxal phosphate-dependent enzyme [Alphaproteobacteria bacterium]
MPHTLEANWLSIRQRIRAAAERAGRDTTGVKLIAVSKFHLVDAVLNARALGQNIFGENRVQEATQKFASLRDGWPELELHMIGPLQTNKAEDAVRLFDVIQTLDRPRLADALAAAMRKTGKQPRLYIEVNVGREPQKAGVMPEDLPAFLDYCRMQAGLHPVGLMCIPPAQASMEQGADAYFKTMQELARTHNMPHLSMGMSDDFEEAIAAGATEVRIGTALFGERKQI